MVYKVMRPVVEKACALVMAALFALPSSADDKGRLLLSISKAIHVSGAQVGVAVVIDGRDTLSVNDYVRYPLMSVFKFHQALAVADYLKRHGMGMGEMVHVEASDMRKDTYSPLRDKYPAGNFDMSVGELLGYTLQLSDNNAADLLFRRFVSVGETDSYVRSLGVGEFKIAHDEAAMHEDIRRCYDNWTTPLAAANLLERFVTELAPGDERFGFIRQKMLECTTRADRLAAPLAGKNVVLGHKTGTGDRNADGNIIGVNDIGFVSLPNGHRYTIAVFVKDAALEQSEASVIIAEISALVYAYVSSSVTE